MARNRRRKKTRGNDARKRAADVTVSSSRSVVLKTLFRFWKKHWKFLLSLIVSIFGGGYLIVVNFGNKYYNITIQMPRSDSETNTVQIASTGDEDADSFIARAVKVARELSRGEDARPKDGASFIPKYAVLKGNPGLGGVVEDIRTNYETGNVTRAATIARTAYAMIAPTLDEMSGKSFSIEVSDAKNISSVYCMLAEEEWGAKRYDKSLAFIDTAIALWADHPPGDLVAIRYAILIQMSRTAVAIVNDDILHYAQTGGKTFMRCFIARLKTWGYVQDVAIDMDAHKPCYFHYYAVYGKPSYAGNPGIFKMEWPKVEEGPQPYCSYYLSQRYAGMGVWEGCIFPRPNDEEESKHPLHNHILLVSTSIPNPPNHGYDRIALIRPSVSASDFDSKRVRH